MPVYHPGYEGCACTTRVMKDVPVPPGYVRCLYTTRVCEVPVYYPGYERMLVYTPPGYEGMLVYTPPGYMLGMYILVYMPPCLPG